MSHFVEEVLTLRVILVPLGVVLQEVFLGLPDTFRQIIHHVLVFVVPEVVCLFFLIKINNAASLLAWLAVTVPIVVVLFGVDNLTIHDTDRTEYLRE